MTGKHAKPKQKQNLWVNHRWIKRRESLTEQLNIKITFLIYAILLQLWIIMELSFVGLGTRRLHLFKKDLDDNFTNLNLPSDSAGLLCKTRILFSLCINPTFPCNLFSNLQT